jgi:hypothetical protein
MAILITGIQDKLSERGRHVEPEEKLQGITSKRARGFGTVSLFGFTQIPIGAFSLSACYWYTGKNLAAVILLHAYWDVVGALVFIPNIEQYGPIMLMLGQLSLPATVLIITHRLRSHLPGLFSSDGRSGIASPGSEPDPAFVQRINVNVA